MKLKGILTLFFLILMLLPAAYAQYSIELVDSISIRNRGDLPLNAISYRGLCVVNDKVIWVSGSKGSVAKSIDGGKTFTLIRVKGFENYDFRDIEAFSEDVAILICVGSPGFILKTFDGGINWQVVFQDDRPGFFLDAIDFWDYERGVAIGDPMDDRFVLLGTIDGGNTWTPFDTSMRPWAIPGESLFAASGTSFKCMPKNAIAFVTGGTKSAFHWLQINKKYQRFELKSMKQGMASQGAFSFDFNENLILVVGGDYAVDSAKTKQGIYGYTYDKDGLQLLNMKPFYSNYKSCIKLLENGDFITCGTLGVDRNNTDQTVTVSNRKTHISDLSFNVVAKAKKGNLVVLAGSKGKIGILKLVE